MSAPRVDGNVQLIQPLAAYSQFARSTTTDLATADASGHTLVSIATGLPVPNFVADMAGIAHGQTIGAARASLTDDQAVYAVMDWIWRNCYFTGTNQVTTPALQSIVRALEIYEWKSGGTGPSGTVYSAGNPALNAGKGPTMACAVISALFVGLLAGLGIPARLVTAQSATQGGDTEAEYWSPTYGKWVLVLAPMNAYKTFTVTGVPCSFLEHALVERNQGLTAAAPGAGIFTGVGLDGSTGYDFTNSVTEGPYWQTFSQYVIWARGNLYVCSTSGAPGALIVPPRPGPGFSVTALVNAHSVQDIEFTVNGLHLSIEQRASGFCMAYLEHNMLELAALQVKAPGGSWANISEAVAAASQNEEAIYGFYPKAGDVWQFRATGTLGNESNIVTVTCQ